MRFILYQSVMYKSTVMFEHKIATKQNKVNKHDNKEMRVDEIPKVRGNR